MCALDSIMRCASAASASGYVACTSARSCPASMSGQTCSTDLARDRRLLRDRARPQRRSGDGQPSLQHRERIDRRLRAAEHADLHQTAVHGEHVDVALQVVAADHVEHDVDAAAAGRFLDRRHEVGFAIVDRALGAERLAGGALLRRTGGRQDSCAARDVPAGWRSCRCRSIRRGSEWSRRARACRGRTRWSTR